MTTCTSTSMQDRTTASPCFPMQAAVAADESVGSKPLSMSSDG